MVAIIAGFFYWNSKNNLKSLYTSEQATSTTAATTKASIKINCENFSMTNSIDTNYLPISCIQEIGNGELPVDVTILASTTNNNTGELHISRNGKDIFVIDGESGIGGEFISYFDRVNLSLEPGSFDFEDVTFDGYKDLVIETGRGAYNFSHSYFAYNPKTKTFDLEAVVDDVTNESFDPVKKQIYSHFKGRGVGDIFTDEIYEFRNGKYVLIEDFNQETVDDGRDDTVNPKYTQIRRKLIDGKMVEVENKTVTYNELYGQRN